MQNIAMMQPQRKTQYHYQLTLLWYIEVPLVAFEKIPFGRSVFSWYTFVLQNIHVFKYFAPLILENGMCSKVERLLLLKSNIECMFAIRKTFHFCNLYRLMHSLYVVYLFGTANSLNLNK